MDLEELLEDDSDSLKKDDVAVRMRKIQEDRLGHLRSLHEFLESSDARNEYALTDFIIIYNWFIENYSSLPKVKFKEYLSLLKDITALMIANSANVIMTEYFSTLSARLEKLPKEAKEERYREP